MKEEQRNLVTQTRNKKLEYSGRGKIYRDQRANRILQIKSVVIIEILAIGFPEFCKFRADPNIF